MQPEVAILGIALALVVGIGAGLLIGRQTMKGRVREIKSQVRN